MGQIRCGRVSLKSWDGKPCLSEEDMGTCMHDHFSVQFRGPERWVPPQWIYGEFPNSRLRNVDALDLDQAISYMKAEKSCCRFDVVVAEMVKPLLQTADNENGLKIELLRE
eukprot:3132520-Pyramimonas_sp.AAC.1